MPTVGDEDYGIGPTTALLSSIRSLQSSGSGYNAVISPTLGAANLERLSDTQVRVTITNFYDFDIVTPETIQVVVPSAALTSSMPLTATPTFALLPLASSVLIAGELASGSSEVAIRVGLNPVLRVTLESDTWVPTLGRDPRGDGPTRRLIDGLVSAQSEPNGWNAIVRPTLPPSAVTYVDAGEVHITVPAYPSYEITEPETVTLSIPTVAMRNKDTDILSAASFVVLASPGTATLGGSMLAGAAQAITQHAVRVGAIPSYGGVGAAANVTLDVQLTHDTFTDHAMCDHTGDVNVSDFSAAPLHEEWCWSPPPMTDTIFAPPPPPPGRRCEPQQENGSARYECRARPSPASRTRTCASPSPPRSPIPSRPSRRSR